LPSGHAKSKSKGKRKSKPRTNKKLEQRILTLLGIQEMRNPETNARGSITPLQISKQVPDLILHSFDEIQNTMYGMKRKGLLHKIERSLLEEIHKDYNRLGTLKSEEEETQFQISVNGIIQFRKSIRPIARLAISEEEKYQTIVDKTEGDPEVKANLKKVPEEIRQSVEGYANIKTGIRKKTKRLMDKIENEAYNSFANRVVHHGWKAAVFVMKLIFFKEDAGTDLDLQDWTL
jgi:hypothetical protein